MNDWIVFKVYEKMIYEADFFVKSIKTKKMSYLKMLKEYSIK